ncbi:hypothetical protein GWI33_013068 [Rhynchophorus ferrugineus]|uniref:Spondin-like TSP1 domain-containing protein n=1 Tax=Rhynchophorus ferrugineus TaxID=354439 RepID=A0A834I455_RHYFE|nr:hypothetical protein GWI33_013068 [Rhynchophorus ferrugineus]
MSTMVDCQVTPWGPWSACDADCGPGTMSRSRSIKIQPQNGGRHCPSLEQRRGCQVSTCYHHSDPAIKGKKNVKHESLSVRHWYKVSIPNYQPLFATDKQVVALTKDSIKAESNN